MDSASTLPRSVRIGYGSGSVATGAFGTVPGLMLLPYLTDSLGIAAIAAGFIVFAPKAWDVVLNPIAGAANSSANATARLSPARSSHGRRGPRGSSVRSLIRPATGFSTTSHAFGTKTFCLLYTSDAADE